MYITYDLRQETRGNGRALYPKVKRVYIAGDVKNWQVGTFKKRTGRQAYGVKIDYEQRRQGYTRSGYTAKRGDTDYKVPQTKVKSSKSGFSKVVEVPEDAQNVEFYTGNLPKKYRDTLQTVR